MTNFFLGEKWGQTTDRHTWEKQAEKDKARYDKEMAAHTAMLDDEAADVRRERDAYAAGPSDREAERSQKRQEMQEETAKLVLSVDHQIYNWGLVKRLRSVAQVS